MTRLKRITNKIFGNTASTTGNPDTGAEIGQFGSAKAGTYNATADVETIQALPAYEQGWIGAVIPDQQYPTLPEMTGVNKVLSYQTGYLMQEGIPEWDSGTTYYKNSIVKYATVTTTQTTTASIGVSTGITSASVNKNTFVSQISVDGNYTFTYNGTSWLYNGIATDLNIYGITYTGTPAENDAITVTLTTTTSIGDLGLYKSLTDDNIGNNPTAKNSIHWEVLNLGGSSLENKISNCILEAPNGVATYSGNTITVKEGLKVLIPNGRNADGTLKNIEYTLQNDSLHSPYIGSEGRSLFLSNSGYPISYNTLAVTTSNHNLTSIGYNEGLWYSPSENKWFQTSDYGTTWNEIFICYIGKFSTNNTQIIGFNPETTVELFKRQDRNEISGLGMPSSKYADLTLGASGSTYTAPANGWYTCYIGGLTTVGYIYMRNNANNLIMETRSTIDGTAVSAYVPVQKGQSILVNYDAVGTGNLFRFIYAEGEV